MPTPNGDNIDFIASMVLGNKRRGRKRVKTNSLVGLVLYGVRGNDPGWLLIPPRPLDLVNPDIIY